ncbi:MAG: thioredoxin family protein [Halolamina sp.]|uniref:TlpA family protein disulfide reductase n=1 Tax=Halolamina sp. TaxID=1940283 RepID=UPI002FC2E86F
MSEAKPEAVLSTMQPDPAWDPASYEEAVETLARAGLTFRVWGGDWCPDCRNQLPAFAAALDAAGVPDERIDVYAVERENGEKVGEGMDEYGVEFIPTVILVDEDGEEITRFVESEDKPITAYLVDAVESRE